MTALHIEHRPFPGHEPAPHDPTRAASTALAHARLSLADLPPQHPAGCRCSVWCRDEWVYAAHGAPAFGHCVVCNELARSIDEDGNVRHPTCRRAAS